ncbi:hypothetical protein HCY52_08025 [Acinetobacter radioresistens]|uniref:PcfJ domain-containing protein n=1 Tax=Acinetobacter radioresistens TaxID=40216 RepID=UPI002004F1A4|nr:PcfJ domain-containing protein [Acinetobacter radioresistens]MCK4083762.1 hypothetical protein [Acinetobacter radioresistens]
MLKCSSVISKEYAIKINQLIDNGIYSSELSKLIQHVCTGVDRILNEPVVVQSNGEIKTVDIFEHYRAVRDENDRISLFIKYGNHEDEKSKFEPYFYGVNNVETNLKDPLSHNYVNRTHWGNYKWIFDLPLDSSNTSYNSFVHKGYNSDIEIHYLYLAIIIKMAEYLDVLHLVDHDLMMYIADPTQRYPYQVSLRNIEFKEVFLALYEVVKEQIIEIQHSRYSNEREYDCYWCFNLQDQIKKHLKSLCSSRHRFLFEKLTKIDHRQSDKNVNKTMRISRMVYITDRFAPYIERIKKLEKYSKAQLYYLLIFVEDIDQINDLNFFSYERMVEKEGWEKSFKFPNKVSLRNFIKLDVGVLEKLLLNLKKKGMLEDWFVESTNEYNAHYSNYDDINLKYNRTAWEVLMAWLTHGECHGQIKSTKEHADQIALIRRIIRDVFDAADYLVGGRVCENTIKLCGLRSDKLALTLDFCIKYIDYLGEELRNEKADLAVRMKDIKADWKQTHGTRSANILIKQLEKRNLFPLMQTYNQKMNIFYDFILHWDEDWNRFTNLECIDRTTTFKSFESKIDRWHDKLQSYTKEELEKAKSVKYTTFRKETLTFKDGVFEPIQNQYELMVEGAEMRHCVASFHWLVMSCEYLVFKVNLGDERATLGIRVNKDQKNPFEFEQCFKKYNHIVSDEMRNLAIKFVDQLNKKPKLILADL